MRFKRRKGGPKGSTEPKGSTGPTGSTGSPFFQGAFGDLHKGAGGATGGIWRPGDGPLDVVESQTMLNIKDKIAETLVNSFNRLLMEVRGDTLAYRYKRMTGRPFS